MPLIYGRCPNQTDSAGLDRERQLRDGAGDGWGNSDLVYRTARRTATAPMIARARMIATTHMISSKLVFGYKYPQRRPTNLRMPFESGPHRSSR